MYKVFEVEINIVYIWKTTGTQLCSGCEVTAVNIIDSLTIHVLVTE